METYTPGHTETSTDFMSQRTWQSHGGFFHHSLTAGMSVLDLGCGPGTITLGIAAQVHPGHVTGVDFGGSQIAMAQEQAAEREISNVTFLTGDAYALPLEDRSVNAVFCHAVFEHLQFPMQALEEIHRVLKPGGLVGICSPDWGGFVLAPPSAALDAAIATYQRLQTANGGDVRAGKKLGVWLEEAGFTSVHLDARYECYACLSHITSYLADQLHRVGEDDHAAVLERWSQSPGGMFAQAWISAVARKA